MNGNYNKDFINSAIKASGGKLDAKAIKNAAENGNPQELLSKLSDSDREKINSLLKDKSALSALLKSPQAAELMKKLSGGGKNG